jgi:hypothetical protein
LVVVRPLRERLERDPLELDRLERSLLAVERAVVFRPLPLDRAFSSPRTPRTTPRPAATTTSPVFSPAATPWTAPRRSASRVRGEKTAAVSAATKAVSPLITSSSPTVFLLGFVP